MTIPNFYISYNASFDDVSGRTIWVDTNSFYMFDKLDERNLLAGQDIFNNYIIELRNMIEEDCERIIETRIRYLNNNESLLEELWLLHDTINNGTDFNGYWGHNFFFRTDQYLCFNNYEILFDKDLIEFTYVNDPSYDETIVIFDNHLKNYYFVRKKQYPEEAESATVNAYQIKDHNIKKRKVNFKRGLQLEEYNDQGIEKMLSKVWKK